MAIELFYDVVSPYSFAAFTLLERYGQAWDIPVALRPAFLGGVMTSTGNTPPAFLPARAPYLFRDVGRLSRRVGITLELPEGFPVMTLKAMRVLTAVQRDAPEQLAAASRAFFEVVWSGTGANVEEEGAQRQALEKAGLGPDAIDALLAAAASDDVKGRLRAATDELVERGGFGAPTYFYKGEMYFGSDRIEQLAFDHNLPYRGAHP